jgi:hypothetical protein
LLAEEKKQKTGERKLPSRKLALEATTSAPLKKKATCREDFSCSLLVKIEGYEQSYSILSLDNLTCTYRWSYDVKFKRKFNHIILI